MLKDFRSGIEPFLLTGDSASGQVDAITFENGQFYYGHPEQLFGIRIQAEEIEYRNESSQESLRFNQPTLYIGSLP